MASGRSMKPISVVLLFLGCAVLVASAASLRTQMEGQKAAPSSWARVSPAFKREPVTLYVALKQQNTDVLEQKFWSVSDPQSSDYGNYWSRKEMEQIIAPSDETVDAVREWLSVLPLSQVTWKSEWVVVKTHAEAASRLLDTEFSVFQDPQGLQVVKSVKGFSVPTAVFNHIDLIGGVSDFPSSMQVYTSEKEKMVLLEERFNQEASNSTSPGDPVILYMLPGDTTLSAFFQPFCLNGNYTVNQYIPCAEQNDSPSMAGVQQRITQVSSTKVHKTTNLDGLVCKPCNEWTSRQLSNCQSQNEKYNYPDITVYCDAPVTVNLLNYYPIEYSLAIVFEDTYSDEEPVLSNFVPYTARPLYLGTWMTPDVLLSRYGIAPGRQIVSNPDNSQSVAEFSAQYYSQEELDYWFTQMNVAPGPVIVEGRNAPAYPGQEATLDIQFMMGVAQNCTTYFWTEGFTFLGWIVDTLNSDNPPYINSVSYAGTESDYDASFITRINEEFQKAANLGVTVLFASGDWGVSFPGETVCTDIEHFAPLFPASSPYVVSVGGTQFSTVTAPICTDTIIGLPMTCSSVGEIACSITTGSRITTGGGFSDLFPMPPYQTDVVNHYLDTYVGDSIPAQYYNRTNRAYPDVAASARNYLVYVSGDWNPVDGTSAATPVFAALLTLANEERLNSGNPTVGFANPMLYQNMYSATTQRYSPEYYNAYYDILMGDNKCGELGMECCPYGWSASPGWDAVTGLGTSRNILEALRIE